jgi:hypothetical protein
METHLVLRAWEQMLPTFFASLEYIYFSFYTCCAKQIISANNGNQRVSWMKEDSPGFIQGSVKIACWYQKNSINL